MSSLSDQKQQQLTTKSSESMTSSRVPYIHWIHCNLCYEQYMKKARQFHLLACDHVCCEGCVQNISETTINGPQTYKCPLCGRQTRACKLGNEMPSHLKELFHPEPYVDGLNTYRVMVFQEKHRRRFMDYLDRQFTAIQERKKEVTRIKAQAKKNYQELEELKIERKQLEKRVIAIKYQRKELEEKRKSNRSNSSDTSSHSSSSKKKLPKVPATNTTSSGITSFSHHSSNHSFIL